jgi:hypothetical protein
MESPMIFSVGHSDRQLFSNQTTYWSRRIFNDKTDRSNTSTNLLTPKNSNLLVVQGDLYLQNQVVKVMVPEILGPQ